MAVESATDRLSYLSDFGVTATISYKAVTGIFDNEFYPVDMGGIEVESNQPVFACRTADLPSITIGTTTCTIDSVAYVILSNHPDGTGMTSLRLREPS